MHGCGKAIRSAVAPHQATALMLGGKGISEAILITETLGNISETTIVCCDNLVGVQRAHILKLEPLAAAHVVLVQHLLHYSSV